MVYGTVVGLVVAAGALCANTLAQQLKWPRRWVWGGALVVTVALVVSAPYRGATTGVSTRHVMDSIEPTPAALPFKSASWTANIRAVIERARQTAVAPLEAAIDLGSRPLSTAASRYLTALWVVLSAALLTLFAAVESSFRRARRRWPVAHVHGVRVRVSPQAGPAVVGLRQPEIVVPQWLLGRHHEEQRLVITHELEHVRARDHWLLAFGCIAVALVPWNVAAWWIFARLRLAVELDCDARVLSRNVSRRSYGELLIDLAEHCSGLRVGAPALAGDASHLQQRLLAMQRPVTRFVLARGATAGVLMLSALVVACEAKLPTSSEIAAMDVAAAERSATASMLKREEGELRYVVDGERWSAERARALRADEIGSIEVTKSDRGGEIRITTVGPYEKVTAVGRDGAIYTALRRRGFAITGDSVAANLEEIAVRDRAPAPVAYKIGTAGAEANKFRSFPGILLIDGARATDAALEALDRNTIESVEVIKGPSALQLFDDPRAVNGIIRITTKVGATRP
jgi:beta-lactamase regulating signal transducer with metallopeptidase domain